MKIYILHNVILLITFAMAFNEDNNNLGDGFSLSGSEFLGKGFDYITGTGFCYTAQCLQEGFRPTAIFNLQYYTNTNACTIKEIPRGSSVSCTNSGTVDSQTVTFNSLEKISAFTSESEGSSIGYRRRFSSSQSYTTSKLTESVNAEDMTVFHTFSSLTAYTLSIANIRDMKFSKEFLQAVAMLPVTYDSYIYLNFIQTFGLSYVSSVVLGGRAQEIIYMQNTAVVNYTSTGKSASQAASARFFIRVGSNHSSTVDNSDLTAFSSYINTTEAYWYGGQSGIQNLSEWIPTVQSNTLPISIQIVPIYNLLTSYFFPNDPYINSKQANFNTSVENYYPPQPTQCPYPCQQPDQCVPNPYMNVMYCNCTGTELFGSTCSVSLNNSLNSIQSQTS